MKKKWVLLQKAFADIISEYNLPDECVKLVETLISDKLRYIQSGKWAIMFTNGYISVLEFENHECRNEVIWGAHHTELSDIKSVRKYFEYLEEKHSGKV